MKLNFSFFSSLLDVRFHLKIKNPLQAKKCPTQQKQKQMQKSDISQTVTIINRK